MDSLTAHIDHTSAGINELSLSNMDEIKLFFCMILIIIKSTVIILKVWTLFQTLCPIKI